MSEIKTKFNLEDVVWYVRDYGFNDYKTNKDGKLEYNYFLGEMLITGIKINSRDEIIYESDTSGYLMLEDDSGSFISYDKQECINWLKKRYEEYIQKEIEEMTDYLDALKNKKIVGVLTR